MDEPPLFQLCHILSNRVLAHPHRTANGAVAGIALVGGTVFNAEQISVDRNGSRGQAQLIDLIGQREIVFDWVTLRPALLHLARIIKTISKGVVLIISPFLKKLYCRSSYLLYNQNKHCGFVSIALQLRLFGGDSNRSGLPELVISWVTLDVSFA